MPLAVALAIVVGACSDAQPASPTPTADGTATASPTASPNPSTTLAPTAPPSPTPPAPSERPTPAPPPPPPCGEADPDCLSVNVVMTRDIDVTTPVPCGGDAACLLKVDSFALPRLAGQPGRTGRPVVVMIPGGPLPPGNRSYLWSLARIVASRGAVAFTADYRSSPAYGGGYPPTFADVACAIRFARQRAPQLGGDPSRVTLVSHSFGGFPGAVLALSASDYAEKGEGCVVTTGDGRPDAFVGIAGVYSLDRIGPEFLVDFFGGDRATAPAAWGAGDVTVLARRSNRRSPPVRLMAGTNDLVSPPATADAFAAILRASGYEVEITVVDGATHDSILDKVATVDAVLGTAAR